eukprot:1161628-Pelagomonas_calceolata.AAC.13
MQNPDPSAAEYFASFVSKAYAALTDEVSRGNYEKYGHPDGPQVCVCVFLVVTFPELLFWVCYIVIPLPEWDLQGLLERGFAALSGRPTPKLGVVL